MKFNIDRYSQLLETIHNDAMIICKYLDVNIPLIVPRDNNSESYCHRRKGWISLGVENGYNRYALIHELLHWKGYDHFDFVWRSGLGKFESVKSSDDASNNLEKMLFVEGLK